MLGDDPQPGVVARDRLVRTIEREQGVAAIAERIDMAGRERERALEARQCLGGAGQPQQGHAAPVERVRIVRRNGVGGVIASQCLLEAPHGKHDKPQIRVCVGAQPIDPQG